MKAGMKNALVIGALLLVSFGLILATRFLLPGAERSPEEIQRQMTDLSQAELTFSPEETRPAEGGQDANAPETEGQNAGLTQAEPIPSPTLSPEETENTAGGQAAKAPEAEAYLYVYINGRLYGIVPLGEEQDMTVDQGDGVVNVVHLLPNGFYMASSTCDNQLCVMEGVVTVDNYRTRILGTSVLCLPHGLDLELIVPSHTPDPNAPDI